MIIRFSPNSSPDEIERLRKEMANKKTEKTETKDTKGESSDIAIESGISKDSDSGNESSGSSSGSASPSSPEKDDVMNFPESADSLLNGDISSANLNQQPVAVGGEEWIVNHISHFCVIKPTKWLVRPVNTPISSRICPVWSVFAVCSMGSLCLHADSEDSDRTEQRLRLIRVFTGHTGHFVICHCCGSFRVLYKIKDQLMKNPPSLCIWDKAKKISIIPHIFAVSLLALFRQACWVSQHLKLLRLWVFARDVWTAPLRIRFTATLLDFWELTYRELH